MQDSPTATCLDKQVLHVDGDNGDDADECNYDLQNI